MKLGAREKKILIILLGAAIFAATYFFLFQKMQEKNEDLKNKIAALNKQVKELNLKISHENEYRSQTEAMQQYIRDSVYRFPSYLQIEDGIMNVVDLEHDADVAVSVLTVGDPELVPVEAPSGGAGAAARTVSDEYNLYRVATSVNYEATYGNLKMLINQIVRTKENPRSMGTLSAVFNNSSGILAGQIDYNSFFISGLDKDYVAPYIPSMSIGTDNPFGSIERKDDGNEKNSEKTSEKTSEKSSEKKPNKKK